MVNRTSQKAKNAFFIGRQKPPPEIEGMNLKDAYARFVRQIILGILSFPRKSGQGAENLRKRNRYVHESQEDLRC